MTDKSSPRIRLDSRKTLRLAAADSNTRMIGTRGWAIVARAAKADKR